MYLRIVDENGAELLGATPVGMIPGFGSWKCADGTMIEFSSKEHMVHTHEEHLGHVVTMLGKKLEAKKEQPKTGEAGANRSEKAAPTPGIAKGERRAVRG